MLRSTLLLLVLVALAGAEYDCACNFNVEETVFPDAAMAGQPIGYVYEFDCKPIYGSTSDTGPIPIQFENQVGYVRQGPQMKVQICPGEPAKEDLVPTTVKITSTTTKPIVTTTTTTTTTTTPKPTMTTTTPKPTTTTTTTTPKPTTTTTTTTPKPTTTTTTTTPKPTTTTSTTTPVPTTTTTTTTPRPTTTSTTTTPKPTTTVTTTTTTRPTTRPRIVEGNLTYCPNYLTTDAARNGGFLGQFGRFCYELVNTAVQWGIAERHCKLASSGHLVYITSQAEQDYIVRFLSKHHYVEKVWTGLTDAGTEGTWKWSSNATVTYKNFQGDFSSHSSVTHGLNDCIVLEQGGQWTDLPCGVSLVASIGFGEKHPYICKHELNSTMFSEFNNLGTTFIG